MTDPHSRRSPRAERVIRGGALAIGVVLFAIALYYINFRTAIDTIGELGVALPLALLFSGLWHLVRTWAWAWCFPATEQHGPRNNRGHGKTRNHTERHEPRKNTEQHGTTRATEQHGPRNNTEQHGTTRKNTEVMVAGASWLRAARSRAAGGGSVQLSDASRNCR